MIECNTDNNGIRIILSQNLTIQDAPELKILILDSLKNSDVRIDIGSNLETDAAILQIIYSAVKTAEAMGRILIINFKTNEGFAGILELSGFNKVLQNNLSAEE